MQHYAVKVAPWLDKSTFESTINENQLDVMERRWLERREIIVEGMRLLTQSRHEIRFGLRFSVARIPAKSLTY